MAHRLSTGCPQRRFGVAARAAVAWPNHGRAGAHPRACRRPLVYWFARQFDIVGGVACVHRGAEHECLRVCLRGPAPEERVPPQDVHAEQSVLGGMLLSKDAIADCVEGLRGTDFYRPAHELIYDAILDLYGRGEPADAITVSDELSKRGDLQRDRRPGLHPHAHPGGRPRRPTPATTPRSSPSVPCCAAWSRPAPASSSSATSRAAATSRTSSTPPRPRSMPSQTSAAARTTPPLGDVLEQTLNEIEVASGHAPTR